MNGHDNKGNCWNRDSVYDCSECGFGNLCDACHDHDEPRGECSECPPCSTCEVEEETRVDSGV